MKRVIKLNSIIRLYNKKKEIVNYLIVGGLTTLVSLGAYYLIINLFLVNKNGLDIQISNIISWVLSVIFAYFTNRYFVFKSKSKGKEEISEFVKFVTSRIATLLIDMSMMFIFVTLLHFGDTLVKFIIQIIIIIVNYLLSKFLVFDNNKQ
jgi:putative flippase GtrA